MRLISGGITLLIVGKITLTSESLCYDYFAFIGLLRNPEFLISDGGSNQEETSYLGLPCPLLRKKTERVEGLGENVVISDYDAQVIVDFGGSFVNHRRPERTLEESPSELIVGHLTNL